MRVLEAARAVADKHGVSTMEGSTNALVCLVSLPSLLASEQGWSAALGDFEALLSAECNLTAPEFFGRKKLRSSGDGAPEFAPAR